MTTNTPREEEWEKDFDDKFSYEYSGDWRETGITGKGLYIQAQQPHEIKSFIRNLLAQERAATEQRIKMEKMKLLKEILSHHVDNFVHGSVVPVSYIKKELQALNEIKFKGKEKG